MNLKLGDVKHSLLLLDFMWKWIEGIKPQYINIFKEIVFNLNTLCVIFNGYRDLYDILTAGLLRTDKCLTHSFFADPPIPKALF